MFRNQLQFSEFLDHRNHASANLFSQHDHFDVLIIFEAVTNDGRVIVGDGEHRKKLRFRTGLKPEMINPAKIEHFFYYLALLVHLNGVNAAVIGLISVLANRNIERLIHLAQAVLENVRESDQDRQRDTTPLERVDKLLQVN